MNNRSDVQPSTIEILRQVPYLQRLSADIVSELAAIASRHRYQSGTMIFCEGDPTAGIYVIEEGNVKVSRFTVEGREHILSIFGKGDTFNDVSALDGGPNPATATAFSDVIVWRIARLDLQQIAKKYPDLAWALIESIASRTRYLVGLVENLAIRTVKGRLAHLLLEQAQATQADEIPRYMTHEEMANHLGTVREMIGRALNSFSAAGIIKIERHQITILDIEGLATEAEA
jgi:CRP/FNR family transcriptional regulator